MKKCLVVILLALIAFVVCLPAIISFAPVRRAIVDSIDTGLDGDLSVGSWSFRWFGGMELRDLHFVSDDDLDLQIERVTTTRGLSGLLRPPLTVGSVVVTAPRVRMRQLAEPEQSLRPRRSGPVGDRAARPPSGDSRKAEKGGVRDMPPSLDDFLFVGDVRIERAGFVLMSGQDRELLVMERANGAIAISDSESPISIEFEADLNGVADAVRLTGEIRLPSDGDLLVELNQLPLESLNPFLGPAIELQGRIQGAVTATVSAVHGVGVRGILATPDLVVTGERLNGDRVDLGGSTVRLAILDGRHGAESSSIALETPLGMMDVGGVVDTRSLSLPGELTLAGVVIVPELTRNLSQSLGIRDDVVVDSGNLKFSVQVSEASGEVAWKGGVFLRDLSARVDQRVIRLERPIEMVGGGRRSTDGQLRGKVTVDSSFLTGIAESTPHGVRIDVEGDLRKAMAEWRKFANPPVELSGSIEIEMLVEGMTNVLGAAKGSLILANLQIGTNVALRFDRVVAEFENSFMPAGSNGYPVVVLAPKLKIEADGFALNLKAGEFLVDAAGRPCVRDMHVDAHGPLAGILAWMPEVKVAAGQSGVEGGLALRAVGDVQAGALRLDEVSLDTPFIALRGSMQIPDPVDLEGMSITLGGDLEFERLKPALVAFAGFPNDVSLAGSGVLRVNLDRTSGADRVALMLGIDELAIKGPGKPAFSDTNITVEVDVSAKDGDFVMRSFAIASTPVRVSGSGAYRDPGDTRRLSAEGRIGFDFEALTKAIAPFANLELEIAGGAERAFELETSLAGEGWIEMLRETTAEAGLYIERLVLFGVRVGELDVPLVVSNGIATLRLATTVNDGQLVLEPTIDSSGTDPELRLPRDAVVLEGVKLDNAIASDLLARVHPIFRGLAVLGGRVDMRIDRFRVALDPAARESSAIKGEFRLKGVRLLAADFLESVLTLAGETNLLLRAGEDPVAIENRNGRIHSSGLTLVAGDYPIAFSGSVGFDRTVDYYVALPVTRRMVGADVYEFLRDESIRIPIRGTVDRPRLGREEYLDALEDLVKKAGKNLLKKKAGEFIEKEGGALLKDILRGL